MLPHYDRHSDISGTSVAQGDSGGREADAMEVAAEALREVEIEAVQREYSAIDISQLQGMSIDELRAMAGTMSVQNPGQLIERDELIAAIRQRL